MSNTLASTDLIGEEIEGNYKQKFSDIISANNGKLYLIPNKANHVVSFDIQTNDWNNIGNDLGYNRNKWRGSVMTNNGKIYCSPFNSDNVLIIDTNTDTTKLIRLPPILRNQTHKYNTCAHDNLYTNVFFFPFRASKIIKLNYQ